MATERVGLGTLLLVIVLPSCGGIGAELERVHQGGAEGTQAPPPGTSVTDSESMSALPDTDPCVRVLAQHGVLYPAVYERSDADVARLETQTELFREYYGRDAEPYSIEGQPATVSPYIEFRAQDDGIAGLQLGSGLLSVEQMDVGTDGFVALWSDLLNPYGGDLVGHPATQDRELYIQREFEQSYCGLAIRHGDQHEYTGKLNINARRTTSTLLQVESSLLPLLPLPEATLPPDDVFAELIGQTFARSCGPQELFSETSCRLTEPQQVVFVEPVGDAIEYRLAYETQLQAAVCGSESPTWTVFVDAIDGQLIYSVSDRGCPDY